MKRTKSTSSQTYIVRRLLGAHSTQPFFLRIKKSKLKDKAFFHIIGRNKILSPPLHLAITEVTTNINMEDMVPVLFHS